MTENQQLQKEIADSFQQFALIHEKKLECIRADHGNIKNILFKFKVLLHIHSK